MAKAFGGAFTEPAMARNLYSPTTRSQARDLEAVERRMTLRPARQLIARKRLDRHPPYLAELRPPATKPLSGAHVKSKRV
jgi:hypothetical protein